MRKTFGYVPSTGKTFSPDSKSKFKKVDFTNFNHYDKKLGKYRGKIAMRLPDGLLNVIGYIYGDVWYLVEHRNWDTSKNVRRHFTNREYKIYVANIGNTIQTNEWRNSIKYYLQKDGKTLDNIGYKMFLKLSNNNLIKRESYQPLISVYKILGIPK